MCVACGLCARICPTSCLEMHVVPSEEGDRELGEFILKAGRCMFCGLCSQVCPVDAITMSQEYELSVLEREGLVYTKTELASIGAQAPIWWESGVGPDNQQTNAPTRYDRFREVAGESKY
ncbi:MAG: 4Fe-4S binding protein [Thermomicrobiales bacterium]